MQYSVSNLTNGPHTLTILVTGQQDSAALQGWVWVNAFDVTQVSSGSASTTAKALDIRTR